MKHLLYLSLSFMLAMSYACDKTDSTATPQSVQWENLS